MWWIAICLESPQGRADLDAGSWAGGSQLFLGSKSTSFLDIAVCNAVDGGTVLWETIWVDGFLDKGGGWWGDVGADDVVDWHRGEESKEPGKSIDPFIC
jgi:hypothetical protein